MHASRQELVPERQQVIEEQRTARRQAGQRHGLLPLFRGANWAGGDFSETDWAGEDFSGCDLSEASFRGARLGGADLTSAELRDADLREADLTGARGLLPEQLAGADLTRARLDPGLASFPGLDQADKLSESAARVFLTLLALLAFAIVTLLGITDRELITSGGTSKLPLVDVEVPALAFLPGAALLILLVFFYLHLYLQRLWETMATLPAVFPDGRRLDQASHPWLLNDLPRDRVPRLRVCRTLLSRLQNILCRNLAYGLVPLVLLCLFAAFAHVGDLWLTGWLLLCVWASAVATLGFHWLFERTFCRGALGFRDVFLSSAFLPVVFCVLVSVVIPIEAFPFLRGLGHQWASHGVLARVCRFVHPTAFIVAPHADFAEKPASWTGDDSNAINEIPKVLGGIYHGRRWYGLVAREACLVRAEFYDSDLTFAEFSGSDCRDSSFRRVAAPCSAFFGARFSTGSPRGGAPPQGSFFSKWSHCDFSRAAFRNARLQCLRALYCKMDQADLEGVDARSSEWDGCSFHGTVFNGADFSFSRFTGTPDRITAGRVSFIPCDFSGVSLYGTRLVGADLSQVTGLEGWKLLTAESLHGVKLPDEWTTTPPAELEQIRARIVSDPSYQ